MKPIQSVLKTNRNINAELKKNYATALKDPKFKKLILDYKIPDDVAMRYTSKLEDSALELSNCENCKALENCKNKFPGYANTPKLVGDRLEFNYVACKYMQERLDKENKTVSYYDIPYLIKLAKVKDIDVKDKNRTEVIKWLKDFYDNYQKDPKQKGLYLHGSFGSGKTFLIAAFLNELADKGKKVVIVYFPEFLLSLKNFGSDYVLRVEELKRCDILMLDDIGAQANTEWSRDEILGTILQHRMDNGLVTFFTSNYSLEELEEKLAMTKNQQEKIAARRITERIKQLSNQLPLVSANRRK
ncbi:MAG: primosomal protein DnaI [Mollicutes bacterium]|jgi:primosomal protein DnaI|nr:primosomal protein DnaI [Mollicutes bacterium]